MYCTFWSHASSFAYTPFQRRKEKVLIHTSRTNFVHRFMTCGHDFALSSSFERNYPLNCSPLTNFYQTYSIKTSPEENSGSNVSFRKPMPIILSERLTRLSFSRYKLSYRPSEHWNEMSNRVFCKLSITHLFHHFSVVCEYHVCLAKPLSYKLNATLYFGDTVSWRIIVIIKERVKITAERKFLSEPFNSPHFFAEWC